MSQTLPSAARNRLVKILGLLASDKAGERDAAGLAATKLLHEHKLTWASLLTPAPAHREPLHSTWRDTCAEPLKRSGDLRAWEKLFVADLPKFRRISTKQRYVLQEIANRVLGVRNG